MIIEYLARFPPSHARFNGQGAAAAAAAACQLRALGSALQDESGEGLAGKYPDRTPFTGGWAGGEKGLQKFIDEVLPWP